MRTSRWGEGGGGGQTSHSGTLKQTQTAFLICLFYILKFNIRIGEQAPRAKRIRQSNGYEIKFEMKNDSKNT